MFFGLMAEILFDDAVFKGVEGDDSKAAARGKGLEGLGEDGVDVFEFVVNRDAEGLEGAGGGVSFDAGMLAGGFFDNRGELGGGVDGAMVKDGLGDVAGAAFFPVLVDSIGQGGFVPGVDDVCGGEGVVWIEAHVEGAIVGEGEAAVGGVKLDGGSAEVEEDAVEERPIECLELLGEGGVGGVDEMCPVGVVAKAGFGEGERLGVKVETEETAGRGGSLKDAEAVTAGAEGEVGVVIARGGVEGIYNLIVKYGLVWCLAGLGGTGHGLLAAAVRSRPMKRCSLASWKVWSWACQTWGAQISK